MKNLTRKQRLLIASALSVFALAALAATFGTSTIGFNANSRTNIQTDLKIQFQRMGLGTPAGSSGTPFSVLDGGAGSFGQGGTDIPIIYRTLALSGFPPSRYAIQLKLTSRDEFGSDEYGFVRYYNGFTTNREELAGKLVLGSDGENFDGDSATGVAVDLSSDAVSGQTFDVRTGSDLRFQVATNSAYAKAMTSETGTHTGITTRNDQSDFKITSFTSAASISLSCTNAEYSGALAHNATVSFTDAPSSSSKGRELRIWVTNTGSYTFALGTIGGQSILWDAEGSTTQPALPANTLTEIRLYWNGTNVVGAMSTEPIIADGVSGPDPGAIVVKHTDSTLRSAVKADLVALSIISGEAYDADDWNGETDTAPSLDAVRDEIESLRDVILNAPGITADADTTNNTAIPIWTNAITTGQAVQLGARVIGAGPTNVYAFDIRALAKNPSGTASLVGTNDLSIIPSGGTNMSAYWDVSGANAILYVRGFNNENVNWRATNILANTVDLGIDSGGGGGSPTYLVEENFEGAGYEVLGEVAGESYIQTAIPDDAWAYCMFRYTQDGTVNITVISFRTSGGSTSLAGFGLTSSSAATLFANGVTYTSSTTLSPNTTYHVWLHWVKGGTCELAISTSTTRPSVDGGGNVYLSGTGSGSSSAGRLSLRCSGSPTPNEDYTGTVLEGSQSLLMSGDAIIIWDKVRVDDEEIGNNPP